MFKHIYCGIDIPELAVYDAAVNYNYGCKATLDIFVRLNMVPGLYTSKLCNILNIRRTYNAAYHNTPAQKKRRKVTRGDKKKK